jgi:lysophospholipase L1-like esterase
VRRVEPLGADLALIVIGANDLARFVPPDTAAADLGAAVSALRAGGTDVVVVPAPDMSSVPFVPPAFRPAVQAACHLLQQRQAKVVEAAGGRVAAIGAVVGAAFAADAGMFSGDRFHPSTAGYARIAAELVPHMVEAAVSRRDGDAAA